jgi:dihydrofolate reductase
MGEPMSVDFAIVVAADEARGIGRAGALPWRLPGEMAYFKRITTEAAAAKQNAVIMGRRTFDSIAPKFRPLAGRTNVVLSRDPDHRPAGALRAGSLDEALALVAGDPLLDRCFVIGGGALYADALVHPRCTRVYLTRVHARFDCDVFLPAFEARFRRVAADGPHREGALSYTFEIYDVERGAP